MSDAAKQIQDDLTHDLTREHHPEPPARAGATANVNQAAATQANAQANAPAPAPVDPATLTTYNKDAFLKAVTDRNAALAVRLAAFKPRPGHGRSRRTRGRVLRPRSQRQALLGAHARAAQHALSRARLRAPEEALRGPVQRPHHRERRGQLHPGRAQDPVRPGAPPAPQSGGRQPLVGHPSTRQRRRRRQPRRQHHHHGRAGQRRALLPGLSPRGRPRRGRSPGQPLEQPAAQRGGLASVRHHRSVDHRARRLRRHPRGPPARGPAGRAGLPRRRQHLRLPHAHLRGHAPRPGQGRSPGRGPRPPTARTTSPRTSARPPYALRHEHAPQGVHRLPGPVELLALWQLARGRREGSSSSTTTTPSPTRSPPRRGRTSSRGTTAPRPSPTRSGSPRSMPTGIRTASGARTPRSPTT